MTNLAKEKLAKLTPKEKEVLRGFLKFPASNEALAKELGLNIQILKNYLVIIFKKFDVKTRMELYVFAIQHRIFKYECPCCHNSDSIPKLEIAGQIFRAPKEV